ncbi:MAG: type II toxin-antitoxin system VapC family toxin [Selenomonadaceae bacterium]|nr:type II toxin-antitoxin system VapC family toxin [Selenomonadaceae bacterium]
MRYLLDTNICIYAMKNKPAAVLTRLKEHTIDGLCISSIVLAELKHGVYKSVCKEKNARALNEFLKVIEVLPFDKLASEEYGKICAYLESQGKPIGSMDMLIAAHALSQSLILVTNNVREFERVPGLTIENWS